MCFGGGGSNQIAQQQRSDEVARQDRIRVGMGSIARAFDGGQTGVGAATSYDPSKTYYNSDGSTYSQNSGGFGGFGGLGGGGHSFGVTPDQLIKQGKLFTGTQHSGGFDDAFYAKRAADYSAYAMPEVDRQAALEHKDLIYALSRTGNLDSSAAIDKNADLNAEENKQRINVANAGLDSANQLRSQVENTRGNVVAELNATGDNSAAAASALRQVQGLNQPAGFSPIGNLFSSFANSVANIGSRAGNGYSGFVGNGGMGPALFGGSGNSQRVVPG